MGKITIRKVLATFLVFSVAAFAAFAQSVPIFTMIPDKSTITFEATQNNSPVKAHFDKFDADIRFSQQLLKDSSAIITVDIGSIASENPEIALNLQSPAWFDSAKFVNAIFHSTEFRWKGGKQFQVDGTLVIRDKTVPVTLDFTLTEFTVVKAVVDGKTVLKRTAFGVGQGEWAKTDLIKDDVTVTFHIEARPL